MRLRFSRCRARIDVCCATVRYGAEQQATERHTLRAEVFGIVRFAGYLRLYIVGDEVFPKQRIGHVRSPDTSEQPA